MAIAQAATRLGRIKVTAPLAVLVEIASPAIGLWPLLG
jgi:hypothetical protein